MSNEITLKVNAPLAVPNKEFDDLTSGQFMARLNLMQGLSPLVADGKANIGDYVFSRSKEDFVNLGKDVTAMVIAYRYKAMVTGDVTLFYYNTESASYQDIKAKAAQGLEGHLCGIEFLLWLPQVESFATYYLYKTARKQAPELRAYIDEINNRPGTCIISSTNVKWKNKSWRSPSFSDNSAGVNPLPSQEDFDKALSAFQSPVDSNVEVAEEDTRVR